MYFFFKTFEQNLIKHNTCTSINTLTQTKLMKALRIDEVLLKGIDKGVELIKSTCLTMCLATTTEGQITQQISLAVQIWSKMFCFVLSFCIFIEIQFFYNKFCFRQICVSAALIATWLSPSTVSTRIKPSDHSGIETMQLSPPEKMIDAACKLQIHDACPLKWWPGSRIFLGSCSFPTFLWIIHMGLNNSILLIPIA